MKRIIEFKNKTGRTLSFQIEIKEKECVNFETLKRTNMITLSICKGDRKGKGYDQRSLSKYVGSVQNKYLSDFVKLESIWKRYHLNDMKMGTKKQIDAIKAWRKENNIKQFVYDDEVNYLNSIGLLVDNNIKYGCVWLCEEVPTDIIEYLKTVNF